MRVWENGNPLQVVSNVYYTIFKYYYYYVGSLTIHIHVLDQSKVFKLIFLNYIWVLLFFKSKRNAIYVRNWNNCH